MSFGGINLNHTSTLGTAQSQAEAAARSDADTQLSAADKAKVNQLVARYEGTGHLGFANAVASNQLLHAQRQLQAILATASGDTLAKLDHQLDQMLSQGRSESSSDLQLEQLAEQFQAMAQEAGQTPSTAGAGTRPALARSELESQGMALIQQLRTQEHFMRGRHGMNLSGGLEMQFRDLLPMASDATLRDLVAGMKPLVESGDPAKASQCSGLMASAMETARGDLQGSTRALIDTLARGKQQEMAFVAAPQADVAATCDAWKADMNARCQRMIESNPVGNLRPFKDSIDAMTRDTRSGDPSKIWAASAQLERLAPTQAQIDTLRQLGQVGVQSDEISGRLQIYIRDHGHSMFPGHPTPATLKQMQEVAAVNAQVHAALADNQPPISTDEWGRALDGLKATLTHPKATRDQVDAALADYQFVAAHPPRVGLEQAFRVDFRAHQISHRLNRYDAQHPKAYAQTYSNNFRYDQDHADGEVDRYLKQATQQKTVPDMASQEKSLGACLARLSTPDLQPGEFNAICADYQTFAKNLPWFI